MLDTKYKRLEYIQSTGTQYIDTVYVPTNTTKWILDAQFTETTNLDQINGRVDATVSPSGQRISIGIAPTQYISEVGFTLCGGGFTSTGTTANTNRHIFEIDMINRIGKVDSQQINLSVQTIASTRSLFLFARNNGSADLYCKEKIYSSQIYDNGTLVRNMIPVMRKSDNEIGMLDLVEGKFYGNAGTGKFTANLDTMYAIIQGSPTQSPYGVFSGFSGTNYLKLQSNLTLSNDMSLEINIRFKTPSELGTTNQYLFGANASDYSGYIGISYKASTGQFETRLPNVTGGSYSTYTMTANTYYSIKSVIKNNTVQTLLYDANNVLLAQTTVKTFSANWSYATQLLTLGVKTDINNSQVLGSIDLNKSYIKLGSTKYKLQAVVGYTKVGSPTISDGVVSGFSSSNYLTLGIIPNFTKLERFVKFTTNSVSSIQNIIGVANYGGISIDENGHIQTTIYTNSFKTMTLNTTVLSANTTYYYKDILENGIVKGYLFDSNIGLLDSKSEELGIDTAKNYFIGNTNRHDRPFLGSIDLKETYIKINNKLWFNGLEQ
jgi:hypothetical protein